MSVFLVQWTSVVAPPPIGCDGTVVVGGEVKIRRIA